LTSALTVTLALLALWLDGCGDGGACDAHGGDDGVLHCGDM
jgi:hypothetical protein